MAKEFGQLIAGLNGKKLGEKLEAALELGRAKETRAVPFLLSALEDSEARALACWALGMIRDKSVAGEILLLLADDDPLVRHEAVIALGRLGDNRAAKPIARLMKLDPVPKVREECAGALASFPSAAAISALKNAVESDPSEPVRETAKRSIILIRLKWLGVKK